jgi:hypothetical protein
VANPQKWQSYEDVSRHLLEQFASHFGLGRVEGKQLVSGASGTEWELDAKAVRDDGGAIIIVECRRYTSSRLSQEDVGGLAFRISDIGAEGAILVSPLELQSGAKLVAASANIQHVTLRPDSTTTDYLMTHLNNVFVGVSDTLRVRLTEVVHIKMTREDGSIEQRTIGDGG